MQYSGQSVTLREDFAYTVRDQQSFLTRYSNLAATTTVGTTSMGYDAVGRLTNLQHKDGSNANIANYTHTYDAASRVTTEKLNAGATTTYQYDTTDQLTNDAVVTYSYDANGNRTMSGYTTGPNNQLTSDGAWNYYADKNGNITQKINPSTGEVWNFGYDNRNRLTTVSDTTSAGLQMQGTYTHDALGQRVQKAVWTASSGTTTTSRFAYDQRQIIADLDGSSALTTRYLLGTRILERLARVSSAGTVAWLLTDRLGSIRNVVNSSGSGIDTILYDGFGNITSQSSPANGGAYLWAGYRYDSETGFYLPDTSVFRYYEPPIGRWRSVDLIWDGANLWWYVWNNPTNGLDPNGLQFKLPGTFPGWEEFQIGEEPGLKNKIKTDQQGRILVSRRLLPVDRVLVKYLFSTACRCVEWALDLVENCWDDIKSRKDFQVGPNMRVLLGKRDFYIKAMKKVVEGCKSAKTLITVHYVEEQTGRCDPVGLTQAYVPAKGGQLFLCPAFFYVDPKERTMERSYSDQEETIWHEFARLFLWDELPGDVKDPRDEKNVAVWDGIIRTLCAEYRKLVKEGKKK